MNSKIDLMVLGLLSERPMHGYEIHQTLSSDDMKQWVDIGFTSIYHSLSRLKKNGYVVETVDTGSSKQKNVYHLTNGGREAFLKGLRLALAEQEKILLDYNIALLFINKLNPNEAATALRIREGFLRGWLNALNEILSSKTIENQPTVEMILDHTKTIAEKEADWIGSLADRVDGGAAEATGPAGGSLRLMALRGNLKNRALSDVVHIIAAGNRTGTLVLEYGKQQCAVAFKDGKPVSANSSTRRDSGKKQSNKNASEDELTQGNLALLVLDDVYEAFGWPEGVYSFDPHRKISKRGVPIKVTADSMVLEGCRRIDDWEKIRAIVPSDDAIFDLVGEVAQSLAASLVLNERERAVSAALNGVRDVHMVAELCNLSVFETSKVLYGLCVIGLTRAVGSDKADVLKLFKQLSRILVERVGIIAGENIISQIESEINQISADATLPFKFKDGVVHESLTPTTSLTELVDSGREFLEALVNAIVRHLGKSFTVNLLKVATKQLSPKMAEDFGRYGLDDIGQSGEGSR